MKQKILKVLIVLLSIAIIFAGILYYAIYISPERVNIKYDTITSTKIPKSLDSVTIGYFSDVYYKSFMNEERLTKMVEKIKEAKADVILFGGDLLADIAIEEMSVEDISALATILSSIEAPLGKFYVLGDNDCVNEDKKTLVSNILYNSGFENLTNRSTKLHNGKMESITLIGLDNCINGNVDIQTALNLTSVENFNVIFTHTPDPLASLPVENIDLGLAGHSMGGQVRLPGFGAFESIDGAEKYSYGLYTYNGNIVRISNGLGTKDVDMRLFCDPQFNIIVLRKE